MLRISAALLCAALLSVTIALFVQAAHEASLRSSIETHGAPVSATITSCYGIVSGTGITVDGFVCRASITLDGRRYVDRLRGSSRHYQPGQVVAGVADPAHPSTLLLASAAADGAGGDYRRAVVSLAALVVACLATAWCWRRKPEGA